MTSKDDKLKAMLVDSVKDIMKLDPIPSHAMTMREMRELRGYRFSDERLREMLNELIMQGMVKKGRSGSRVYYWFVEDKTQ
jgi:hypothetical protein